MAAGFVTAALAIYGAASAYDKQQKAKKGIEKLAGWKPKYRSAEDIQSEAEMRIKDGYSPEQKANFLQQLTRSGNAAYSKATQVNPNLSSQVQSGINYLNVGALSDFAARDAALRLQRIQNFVGLTRGQSNAQTSADIASKRAQEIAYGNAKNQADAEIYNSIAMFGYGASNMGGTGSTTGTQPQPQGDIQTSTNPMGTYITTPLQDPYGRQAAPYSQNYRPGYNPYNIQPPSYNASNIYGQPPQYYTTKQPPQYYTTNY